MRYKLSILIGLFWINLSLAQETWDLKKCIDYALEHNLNVVQSEINEKIQLENITSAKGQLLPNLNGYASHTYNFGQRIDPFTNQFANQRVQSNNFYLNSQATLFNGFQNKNNIQKSLVDYQITGNQTSKIKNDISLSIATNYLQILFNEEGVKIAQNQLVITGQQLDRIEKMVKAGAIPQGNLLDLQAQYASDELTLLIAENQLQLSTLSLKLLLQLDSIQDFRIAIPQLDLDEKILVTSSPGQVYDAAVMIMPEIKTSELQIESAIKSIQIAKGSRYPILSLSASAGTGYSGASKEVINTVPFTYVSGVTETGETVFSQDFTFETTTKPFTDQISDNLNQSIGFNLSVPVFNGFSIKTSTDRAKLNMELSKVQLEQAKNQLRNDIEQSHANAVAAMKKFRASEKSVEALQLSFDYSQKRFEAGLITAVDFNDAKNKLVNAQSEMLQAKYDYLFKTKILEFYQGKSLIF